MARPQGETMPPLSARSVALSLLLGATPPRLAAADLGRLAAHFGLAPATMRVALSRMVAAGELDANDGVYALSARHLARRETTEAGIHPEPAAYTGTWRMIVATGGGRPADERQATRAALERGRFAPLREGVWMRPGNLGEPAPIPGDALLAFSVVPDDDQALAGRLWDLDAWAEKARTLLEVLHGPEGPMTRLTAAAAAVRHLAADPVLPAELEPADWPAARLRRSYAAYRDELAAIAATASTPETKD
ncbi:PaaX domain-containing protein, C- domain protein [Agromyces archimandritae]|uniref:PaaX domain-containing protein, C- domain protein n=1 Tax=Agromyces archimandritae TaxID=2781962 RepID=A0A975FNB6_9MICO|nr:PaaX domain-containing protein, C- domain protein [Agromyces archimandritae]QTX04171.1 PaaX domain-containing protein, C- domain protein [Agromyces archimandritae]